MGLRYISLCLNSFFDKAIPKGYKGQTKQNKTKRPSHRTFFFLILPSLFILLLFSVWPGYVCFMAGILKFNDIKFI